MRRRSYVKLLGLHRTAGSTWIAGIDTVSDSARGDCYSHHPKNRKSSESTRTIVIIRKGIDSNLSCVTVLHRNVFSLNFISQYLHIFVNEETFSFGAWWIQKRRERPQTIALHCIFTWITEKCTPTQLRTSRSIWLQSLNGPCSSA